ncbi:hypothetical protein M0802_008702 [Mischocyttarus mexicanus]|nr:hypothetical protein M0802_008702 [Mischocyttarus mexicanus]
MVGELEVWWGRVKSTPWWRMEELETLDSTECPECPGPPPEFRLPPPPRPPFLTEGTFCSEAPLAELEDCVAIPINTVFFEIAWGMKRREKGGYLQIYYKVHRHSRTRTSLNVETFPPDRDKSP